MYKVGMVIAIVSTLLLPLQQGTLLEKGISLYWNGEYEKAIETLSSIPLASLDSRERIECHKYLAFSHVALGQNEKAQEEFIKLLSIDPGYSLNLSMASPKIIEQFELAKKRLIETLFAQGKTSYHKKDYQKTIDIMNNVLRLDPNYDLAKEYKDLANERLAAIKPAPSKTAEVKPKVEKPKEPENKIYHLSSDITPPVLLKKVLPVTPKIDRQIGTRGKVILWIVVGKDGSVKEARVLKSINSRIDRAALFAVKKWKYKPAMLQGKPVAVYYLVALEFK